MRRYTYLLFMLTMLIILVVMGYYIKAQVDAIPAWDGIYVCDPTATHPYTLESCE